MKALRARTAIAAKVLADAFQSKAEAIAANQSDQRKLVEISAEHDRREAALDLNNREAVHELAGLRKER